LFASDRQVFPASTEVNTPVVIRPSPPAATLVPRPRCNHYGRSAGALSRDPLSSPDETLEILKNKPSH
jgi:hypothetical protein